jgi:hypothetical protein
MSFVRNMLNAEYRLVRAPATVVERNLIQRLPEESVLRLGAEGGLGVMDTVAGRVTGNEAVQQRGRALLGEVKATVQARWDERRAQQLRNRAESQRTRSYAHARRTEDMAHEQAVETADKTMSGLVEEKAEASLSAVDEAKARALEIEDRAHRRLSVAEQNRTLNERRATAAARHEADFWLGVADSNKD